MHNIKRYTSIPSQTKCRHPLTKQSTKDLTLDQIMDGILITPGQVVTRRSVARSGPRHLFYITKDQFKEGAAALQAANLGTVVRVHVPQMCEMFMKKKPEDVESILEQRKLCDFERYKQKFYAVTPDCITYNMRERLVKLEYMTEDQFII